MEKRNKRMLIVVVILIVANLLMYFSGKNSGSLSFEDDLFSVRDSSALVSIKIGDILLQKEGAWKVDEDPADPAFTDHLVNMMMRVRVKKPIGKMPVGEAIPIQINDNQVFHFSSNETKTKTYFIRDGEGYEMEIPGFTDYLGGIFELEKDQWRDRLVYNGSWRTIQKLTLDYTNSDQNDFTIQFEKDFFKIEGISRIDTTTLMNYMNQFQYFQVNERISKNRIPEMDSLAQTEPLAKLYFDDINIKQEIYFTIFNRRDQDPFYLLLDPNGEMIVVDAPRLTNILLSKQDFKAQE